MQVVALDLLNSPRLIKTNTAGEVAHAILLLRLQVDPGRVNRLLVLRSLQLQSRPALQYRGQCSD
ncbi:hypothetical protein D3C81_2254610 [compost metagenome]